MGGRLGLVSLAFSLRSVKHAIKQLEKNRPGSPWPGRSWTSGGGEGSWPAEGQVACCPHPQGPCAGAWGVQTLPGLVGTHTNLAKPHHTCLHDSGNERGGQQPSPRYLKLLCPAISAGGGPHHHVQEEIQKTSLQKREE